MMQALLLFFVAATIGCLSNFGRAEEENVMTQVSVVHSDYLEARPVFCIGLQPTALAPRSISFNETRAAALLKKMSKAHANLFAFLNQSAQLPENGGLETLDAGSDLLSFVGVTAQMLINIAWLENGVSLPGTVTVASQHYGVNRYDDSSIYVDGGEEPGESSPAMQLFHDYFMDRGVDFPELTKVIGALMCKALKTSLTCDTMLEYTEFAHSNLSLCEPARVTWLGVLPFNSQGSFLCVNATSQKNDTWHFKTNTDTCQIYVRYADWFGKDFKESLQNTVLYLDFGGDRGLTRTKTNNIASYDGQMSSFVMSILGKYTRSSRKALPCNDDSLLDCRGKCRAQWMARNCGCWPISWAAIPGKPASVPYCTIYNDTMLRDNLSSKFVPAHLGTEKCFAMRTTFDPDKNCWGKCVKPCTEFIYSHQLRPFDAGVSDPNAAEGTGFQIKFDNFMFPEFNSYTSANTATWCGSSLITTVLIGLTANIVFTIY